MLVNWVIIVSGNGLSPVWHLNQCWIIVIWNLKKKLKSNCNQNSEIFIQKHAFENVVYKMIDILCWSHCVKTLFIITWYHENHNHGSCRKFLMIQKHTISHLIRWAMGCLLGVFGRKLITMTWQMGAIASQITSLMIVYSTIFFRRRSKKTSKFRVTGLYVGNSPGTGEFPTQMACNTENVSIWWRHHDCDHVLMGQHGTAKVKPIELSCCL